MSTTNGGVPAPLPKIARGFCSRLSSCFFPRRIGPSPQSQDETATRTRRYAAAIVVSSSGADATFECLNDLKSLSSNKDLLNLQEITELYILLSVDQEFKAVADQITRETTRDLVKLNMSMNKPVTLQLKDLYKLDGFLGWSWKDIQHRLNNIKKELKFILYVKKNGQLLKAVEDLDLDHVYLFDETECDTVANICTVLKKKIA